MSKIFIKTDPTTHQVMFTHFMPFDQVEGMGKSETELRNEGFLIDGPIPDPEAREGHYPVAKYTMERGYYYDYEEIPPAPPSAEGTIEKRVEYLEGALQDLLLKDLGAGA